MSKVYTLCKKRNGWMAKIHVDRIDWDIWEPKDRAVLCFLVEDGQVLLIHKKTGLGAGKINGPGGRIQSKEEEKHAAIRELQEEVGLTPLDPQKHGELSFIFSDGYSIHGTVFVSTKFAGEMVETDEAKPFWCPIDSIPYEEMWQDDPYWLPEVLAGNHIRGYFIYDNDVMVSSKIFIYRNKL
jgi:8-oxo-dGTP diphosphatase